MDNNVSARNKGRLTVGGLDIWPPLFLAPMAGLTHSALRTTILSFGGVGLLSTEMLAAWRLPKENADSSPFLVKTSAEKPLSYQLLLSKVDMVEPAIAALERLGADAIDINLGCPAPMIRKAGGGSVLAANHVLVRDIIRQARKLTRLPLTAKIRLGKELKEEDMVGFGLLLQDEGVDLLTVHARLEKEAFCRKPRWGWIRPIQHNLSIPVIANGGIDSVATAVRCLEESGADGLMIGRAAASKPWLFAEIASALFDDQGGSVPVVCLPQVYYQFVDSLFERFRPERRLGRFKEFTHYFATNYTFGHHLATRVQSSASMGDALERAEQFFTRSDPDGFAALPDRFKKHVTSWSAG
ncbi:MAG: dihydrouridine synthase [Desulfobulbus propionicus]|nr:MAG: dihydrouridine synthase [Desulfobulbus propionicus]PIE64059.1 MAG: dihydrouridine synthase [Desulfobacterales bacterium]